MPDNSLTLLNLVYLLYLLFVLQGSNVVEDQDLLEIGILNSAHRQRLLQAIRLLPRVSTADDICGGNLTGFVLVT